MIPRILVGDDTDANLRTLKITLPTGEYSRLSLVFSFLGYTRTFTEITGGTLEVNFTAAQTNTMPIGTHNAKISLVADDGRRYTLTNTLKIKVTDNVADVYGGDANTIALNMDVNAPIPDLSAINTAPRNANELAAAFKALVAKLQTGAAAIALAFIGFTGFGAGIDLVTAPAGEVDFENGMVVTNATLDTDGLLLDDYETLVTGGNFINAVRDVLPATINQSKIVNDAGTAITAHDIGAATTGEVTAVRAYIDDRYANRYFVNAEPETGYNKQPVYGFTFTRESVHGIGDLAEDTEFDMIDVANATLATTGTYYPQLLVCTDTANYTKMSAWKHLAQCRCGVTDVNASVNKYTRLPFEPFTLEAGKLYLVKFNNSMASGTISTMFPTIRATCNPADTAAPDEARARLMYGAKSSVYYFADESTMGNRQVAFRLYKSGIDKSRTSQLVNDGNGEGSPFATISNTWRSVTGKGIVTNGVSYLEMQRSYIRSLAGHYTEMYVRTDVTNGLFVVYVDNSLQKSNWAKTTIADNIVTREMTFTGPDDLTGEQVTGTYQVIYNNTDQSWTDHWIVNGEEQPIVQPTGGIEVVPFYTTATNDNVTIDNINDFIKNLQMQERGPLMLSEEGGPVTNHYAGVPVGYDMEMQAEIHWTKCTATECDATISSKHSFSSTRIGNKWFWSYNVPNVTNIDAAVDGIYFMLDPDKDPNECVTWSVKMGETMHPSTYQRNYAGYKTTAEFKQGIIDKIPATLPNPAALTIISGGTTNVYTGASAVQVNVAAGGGSGGTASGIEINDSGTGATWYLKCENGTFTWVVKGSGK